MGKVNADALVARARQDVGFKMLAETIGDAGVELLCRRLIAPIVEETLRVETARLDAELRRLNDLLALASGFTCSHARQGVCAKCKASYPHVPAS